MRDNTNIELALIAESMSQPPDQRTAWILKRKAEMGIGSSKAQPYEPKGFTDHARRPEGFTAKPFAAVADDVPADWSER